MRMPAGDQPAYPKRLWPRPPPANAATTRIIKMSISMISIPSVEASKGVCVVENYFFASDLAFSASFRALTPAASALLPDFSISAAASPRASPSFSMA
jgi:hypothetical protein